MEENVAVKNNLLYLLEQIKRWNVLVNQSKTKGMEEWESLRNTTDALRNLLNLKDNTQFKNANYQEAIFLTNQLLLKSLEGKAMKVDTLGDKLLLHSMLPDASIQVFFYTKTKGSIWMMISFLNITMNIIVAGDSLEITIEEEMLEIFSIKYFNKKVEKNIPRPYESIHRFIEQQLRTSKYPLQLEKLLELLND